MLKLTMKLTTLSQVHWCVDLLVDLLLYMMTQRPRILNSSSNSFIYSPRVCLLSQGWREMLYKRKQVVELTLILHSLQFKTP